MLTQLEWQEDVEEEDSEEVLMEGSDEEFDMEDMEFGQDNIYGKYTHTNTAM